MTPLYIFDLDGTLADLKHRRYHVERPSLKCYDCGGDNCRNCEQCAELDAGWKPNWDAFHAACVDDTPIAPVIKTMRWLSTVTERNRTQSRCEVWIWSGRMDTVRLQTTRWLGKHDVAYLSDSPDDPQLKMRPAGDFTPDNVLKESWLHAMSPEDRARLVMVFDDRDRVVNMWRRNGVVCAQVAPGDF